MNRNHVNGVGLQPIGAPTPRCSGAVLVAAALFPLLSLGCQEEPLLTPAPPEVGVATPLVEDLIHYAEFTGRTEAAQVVEVRARVEGILLESLARPGTQVNAGDVLFRIDPDQFIAERDAAAARVLRAEAQLRVAQFKRERYEIAGQGGGASELEVLDAEASAVMATADLEVARRDLAIKQLSVDHTEVRAPLTGEIEAGAPDLGSLVGQPGSGPLTRIYDSTSVRVWMTVPDRVFLGTAVARADPSAPIAYPIQIATEGDSGYPHRGVIDYVDPSVDFQTGTIRLRATIDNPSGRLRPGLFVRSRLVAGQIDDAILIPEAAISSSQVGRYVLLLDANDLVEVRPVTLGPREGNLRVIVSGLTPSDRVIISGMLRARPGQPVRPMTERIARPNAGMP